MRSPRALALVVAAVALVAAACGGDDDTSTDAAGESDGVRTVEVAMVDIGFEPETVEVEEGETVRFVFTNEGEIAHDAVIGDEAVQMDHEQEMAEGADAAHDDDGHGDDGHDGGESEALLLEPGETGELTYTFDEAGTLEIGCHQPGHYEAGMVVDVEVA